MNRICHAPLAPAPHRQACDSAARSSRRASSRPHRPVAAIPRRHPAQSPSAAESSHCSTSSFQSAATAICAAGPGRHQSGRNRLERAAGDWPPRLARDSGERTTSEAANQLQIERRSSRFLVRRRCAGRPGRTRVRGHGTSMDPLESAAAARHQAYAAAPGSCCAAHGCCPKESRTSSARSAPVSAVKILAGPGNLRFMSRRSCQAPWNSGLALERVGARTGVHPAGERRRLRPRAAAAGRRPCENCPGKIERRYAMHAALRGLPIDIALGLEGEILPHHFQHADEAERDCVGSSCGWAVSSISRPMSSRTSAAKLSSFCPQMS